MTHRAFAASLLSTFAAGVLLAGPSQDNQTDLSVFARVDRVLVEETSGQPTWVDGDLGSLPQGDPVVAATSYLERVGAAFDLRPDDTFELVRLERDGLGMVHYRVRQRHRGLEVDGGEVILHADENGAVRILNGHLAGGVEVEPTPGLDAEEALRQLALRLEVDGVAPLQKPELVYFSRPGAPAFLAWRADVEWVDADGLHREKVFVDAEDGVLLERQSLIRDALYRKIYTANQTDTIPGTLLFQEGGTSTDPIAMAAYSNSGTVYNFFKNVLGRDSYSGSGAQLKSTVHFVFPDGSTYSPNNAAWDDYSSQFLYGDGDGELFAPLATALDVVAHEYSHAVTSSTANLDYSYESGALNEAWSDIFAAASEAWSDGTVGTHTWKIGEDVYTPGTSGDALRYMNNPTLDGESRDYYPERYTGSADYGGVHWNSGIGNLAFYLASQGGTHPRGKTTLTVPALGITKVRAIFYRALTTYMTPTTNFQGARLATAQATQDLYGATDAAKVHKAWDAVGVPGSPPVPVLALSNGQTVSPLSGTAGSWAYYRITVPTAQTFLEIKIWGGSGDCDLYVRRAALPTATSWDYRPDLAGNTETVNVTNPTSGDWYVGLYGYGSYSNLSLKATYGSGGGGGGSQLAETESNNSTSLADLITATPTVVTGFIGTASDVDYFKLTLPAGRTLTVDMTVPSGRDYDLKLYNGSGTVVATSANGTGQPEHVTYTNTATSGRVIYVKAYPHTGGGYSATNPYTLNVTW